CHLVAQRVHPVRHHERRLAERCFEGRRPRLHQRRRSVPQELARASAERVPCTGVGTRLDTRPRPDHYLEVRATLLKDPCGSREGREVPIHLLTPRSGEEGQQGCPRIQLLPLEPTLTIL